MSRPPMHQSARWALLIAPLPISLAVGHAAVVSMAIAAALVAYDGPHKRSVAAMIGVLLLFELLTSMQPGLLSFPFVVVIALLRMIATQVSLPAPASSVSWSLGVVIRTVMVACGVVFLLAVGAVLMSATVYGAGYLGTRMHLALAPAVLAPAWVLAASLVMVLYRIDVPFHRRTL